MGEEIILKKAYSEIYSDDALSKVLQAIYRWCVKIFYECMNVIGIGTLSKVIASLVWTSKENRHIEFWGIALIYKMCQKTPETFFSCYATTTKFR